MKKLILIILLLPLFAQAQTYQLNYDSIRVGKTAGTGATSLYGKVYLKNVSARAAGDSILSVVNGRIFKVPYLGVNYWSRSGNVLTPSTATDTVKVFTLRTDTIRSSTSGTNMRFTNYASMSLVGTVFSPGSIMLPNLGDDQPGAMKWGLSSTLGASNAGYITMLGYKPDSSMAFTNTYGENFRLKWRTTGNRIITMPDATLTLAGGTGTASSLAKWSATNELTNATSGTDYTLLNGTGIVSMTGTTASYLSSTGTGNVVKATSPTISGLSLSGNDDQLTLKTTSTGQVGGHIL